MNSGKVIMLVLVLIVGLVLAPLVFDTVDGVADALDYRETHIAVEATTDAEVIALDFEPLVGTTDVWVNGSALPAGNFTVLLDVLTVDAADSDTGDVIKVQYDYERDLGRAGTILPMVPIFYILFLLGIAVLGIKQIV